jgi:hemolysin activation/secretion protein
MKYVGRWIALTGLLLTFNAYAINETEQQQILQQQRERDLRERQEQAPDVRFPQAEQPEKEARLSDDESPCFPISDITLIGDLAQYFQFALHSVLYGDDPAIGQCLGTQGINTVLKRVQNAMIEKGYVTSRVLVGPQDLTSGKLELTLIAGRVNTIRFKDPSTVHGRAWNALPIKAGDLLNIRDIEQGLENFKRVPTADANIDIEPSSSEQPRPGESDLVISAQQTTPPFRLTLAVDDGGSKSTGKLQGNATLSVDNPLTLNDLFYVSVGHDLGEGESDDYGTDNYTFHYSLPFGYWTLGFTGNGYNYHQTVVGSSQNYIYSGKSKGSELKLSRLIYRDAVRKTTTSLLGYVKNTRNYIDDTEIEIQRRRAAGWQAELSHREFIHHATLDINLAYRRGTGAMDAIQAPEEAFSPGISRPSILSSQASLNLPFHIAKQAFHYNFVWRAQWNKSPLIAQDRFSIGGRYTIRGFNGENTLSAERGWLIRNELAMPLANTRHSLYLGADYGHVSGQSAQYLLGTHLFGAVVGLRGSYNRLQYDLFVGGPLAKPEGFKASTIAGFNLSYQF